MSKYYGVVYSRNYIRHYGRKGMKRGLSIFGDGSYQPIGKKARGQQTTITIGKDNVLARGVNAVNEDGSIGEFIGYQEILDTGYGRETGIGESKILKGKSIGTIEAGETIDFYMPTLHMAEEWVDTYGDYLYIKLVKGVG